jgi:phage repressor protein C with HTH and peptisase S24 domain
MTSISQPQHDGIDPAAMLREERERAGLTQEALAARARCSKPLLSLMESGRRSITPARAAELERALGIGDGRLLRAVRWRETPPEMRQRLQSQSAASQALVNRLRDAARKGMSLDHLLDSGELRGLVDRATPNIDSPLPLARRIPVINDVAAGYPAEFTDLDYPATIADDYVACPDISDPHAFAARVVGDSMEPEYREGEIVVFSPELATGPGTDCFVRLQRDAESTFKRIYFEEEGESIRLQPLNSKYPPRTVPREDVAAMYAAAYVMRRVRSSPQDA